MSEEPKDAAPQPEKPAAADEQKKDGNAEAQKQRRQNPRARSNFKARCVTTSKQELFGRVTNISIGGMQVQIPIKLKPKSKLYSEIAYYHNGVSATIKVVGEVVHTHLVAATQGFDTGLKFVTELKDKEKTYIKKFVTDMLKK